MASEVILNIMLHILSHTWPEVLSSYKLQCLGTSGVASCEGVVSLAEYVEADVIGRGNV